MNKKEFRRAYYKLLKMDYGEKTFELAKKDVFKYLNNFKTKITPATEKRVQSIIKRRYVREFIKRKAKLKKLMKPYYRSQKKPYKAKKDVSYDLNATDQYSIRILSEADVLWITTHAAKTAISREIQGVILQNMEAGLTGKEITGLLKAKFAEYAPTEYVRRFSEQHYWGMVTQNTVQRTSGFANINSMQEAGATTYIWETRETERTCAICAAMHGKEKRIEHAVKNMDKFAQAVERGDTERMVNAIPSQTEPDPEAFGVIPPLHPNCECDIVIGSYE